MPSRRLSGLKRHRRSHHQCRAARNWEDNLLADVCLAILHCLDHIEILTSAGGVCSSWRRRCTGPPTTNGFVAVISVLSWIGEGVICKREDGTSKGRRCVVL
jgi:hypothetical protein